MLAVMFAALVCCGRKAAALPLALAGCSCLHMQPATRAYMLAHADTAHCCCPHMRVSCIECVVMRYLHAVGAISGDGPYAQKESRRKCSTRTRGVAAGGARCAGLRYGALVLLLVRACVFDKERGGTVHLYGVWFEV